MKLVTVYFKESGASRQYTYAYKGDVAVEKGDIAIANDKAVVVTKVEDGEAIEGFHKEIKYVFSRKAERDEQKRLARIAEIKTTLLDMKRKQDERNELEAVAFSVEGGANLLAELETLEK